MRVTKVWILRSCMVAAIACIATPLHVGSASAAPIGAKGRILDGLLDSLRVEERWLAGDPVDWRTGAYDPSAQPLNGHCSAFVAAACAACGVYVLRPPEHGERLLANAQCAWLQDEGPRLGWKRIDDAPAAQSLANEGNLVIACYKNPERDDPGHITVVRPSAKSLKRIQSEGPDIVQAGTHNYSRTSVKKGFRLHARAWKRSKIIYYAHLIPLRAGL